jgi:hypothetical protein
MIDVVPFVQREPALAPDAAAGGARAADLAAEEPTAAGSSQSGRPAGERSDAP